VSAFGIESLTPRKTTVLVATLVAGALLATHAGGIEGALAPIVDGAGKVPDHGGDQPLGPTDGADLPPTDLDRVKPGDLAPDFTLEDQNGRPVTLSGFRGQRPVVLVFYRGHW
jgi:hypothetical protein